MKRIVVFLALSLAFILAIAAVAWSWNSYEIHLEDGYTIFRRDAHNIILTQNLDYIVASDQFGGIGPIVKYATIDNYIFLMTLGVKGNITTRLKAADIDHDKRIHLIVNRPDKTITGPYNMAEFKATSVFQQFAPLIWLEPQNPHIWFTFFNTGAFVVLSIFLALAKFWYISLSAFALLICWFVLRKRQSRDQH